MGSIPAPEPNVSATAGVPSTPAYRASEALGKHIASDAPTSPASAVLAPSASHGSLAASPAIHELSHPDRQYTPGMTRADLAAKREAEQQRQSLLFQQRGLGKSAEPEIRTSFSDDIGRAFDTISSARSPSPAAQSPTASSNASANANANTNTSANNASRTQAPSTPTPAGRVTTTSRLGDAKNTQTTTPNNAPSRDRLSATPQSQPRSLPQRAPSSPLPPDNVTAVTLDGDTTVFFIDDGLKFPDSTPATPMLGRREGAEPDVYEEDQQSHTSQQNHTEQEGHQGETEQPSQQDQRNVDHEGTAAPGGLGIVSGETPDTATPNGNGAAFALRTGSSPGHARNGAGAGAAGVGAAAAGAAGAGAAMASTGGDQSRASTEGLSAPSDPSRGTSTDTAPTGTASASAPGTTVFPPRDTDAEPEERQGHVGRASLGAVGGTSAFAAMQLASATQRGDARAMSTASITAIHSGMEGTSPKHLDNLASPTSPDSPSRPSPLGRLTVASGRLKSPLSPPLEAPGTPWASSVGTPSREPGTPLLAAPGTPLVSASNAEMEQINFDTARAGEPDTETASITAIRAGREGTYPVSPGAGKSPLSPVPASSDSATDSMQDVSNGGTGTPGTNGTRSGAGTAAAAAAVAGGAAGAGLAATHGNDANASPTADDAAPTAREAASTFLPTTQAPGEDHESVGHPATRGQAGTARDPAPYPPAQRDGPAEHELPHAAHGVQAKHALHADEQKVAHALHPHHEHGLGHEHEHAAAGAGVAAATGAGHAHAHDADAGTGPPDAAEARDVPEPAAAPATHTHAPTATHAPTTDDAPPADDLHSPTSDGSGYHTPPSTADSTALTGPPGFTPATDAATAPKAGIAAQDPASSVEAQRASAKEAQAPAPAPAAKPPPPAGDAASASYAAKFARRPGASAASSTGAGAATAADLGAAPAGPTASASGTGAERPAHASHQRNASSSSSKRKGGLLSRLKGLGGKISHE